MAHQLRVRSFQNTMEICYDFHTSLPPVWSPKKPATQLLLSGLGEEEFLF